MKRHHVELTVNGATRDALTESRTTLADFLRDQLELTGTHLGCEHGVCGACTVLLDGESVKSCTLLAVQANGHAVTTIEALAENGSLNELQQSFQGWNAQLADDGRLMPDIAHV